MTLDECEKIFDRALASKTETEFCAAIEPLLAQYKILSIVFGRGSIFWRGRIIQDEPFTNLSSLDYPPPEYAKQGRLNDQGAPVFYISARKETALAEVGAECDQLVQLAGFRINAESSIRLAIIGEYSNVQKNGYMHFVGRDPDMTISKILNGMPRQDALRTMYIDKFFAHILADPDASKNGYMFSRALGMTIYSKSGAEGVVFPSVKDRGGFNIAVKAEPSDRSFHNVSCIVVRTGQRRRFNLLEYEVVRAAERLDDDLNFVWFDDNDPETIGIYNISKEEAEVANRDPGDRNSLLNLIQMQKERSG